MAREKGPAGASSALHLDLPGTRHGYREECHGDIIGLNARSGRLSRTAADPGRTCSHPEDKPTLQIHAVDNDAWLILEQRMPLTTDLKIMRQIGR